jgi:lactoylglutathione lyase
MYIDHISIYTNDLERLKDFYVKYLLGRANGKYHNEKTGLETHFISFEGGARLELMQRPNLNERDKTGPSDGLTHLSFCVGSRETVDEMTEILIKAGYSLKSGPRETGDGYYESCILDPDSNEVEIVA